MFKLHFWKNNFWNVSLEKEEFGGFFLIKIKKYYGYIRFS